LLAGRLGYEHLSTGQVLRDEIAAGTGLGHSVAEWVTAGELVPDEVMTSLVAARLALAAAEGRGVVLDGFPRTADQAGSLFDGPLPLVRAVLLDLSTDDAVARLAGRFVCGTCGVTLAGPLCPACGGRGIRRADDHDAEAVCRRLAIYRREARAVVAELRLRGVLAVVDGGGNPCEVASRVAECLMPRRDDSSVTRRIPAWSGRSDGT
jgi:adenylate kinase